MKKYSVMIALWIGLTIVNTLSYIANLTPPAHPGLATFAGLAILFCVGNLYKFVYEYPKRDKEMVAVLKQCHDELKDQLEEIINEYERKKSGREDSVGEGR